DFPQYDEFEYSRKINQILGSQSHEAVVGPKEFLSWIEEMAPKIDDPNGDWVCFPVYYLAKLFRDNGVIMGQVGEGSDELFCGYGTYMAFIKIWKKFWRWAIHLPKFLKAIPYFIISKLTPQNFAVLPKEFLSRWINKKPLFFGGANAFSAYDKQFLLTKSFQKQIPFDASDKIVEKIYSDLSLRAPASRGEAISLDFLQKLLYLDLTLRLPELLLMRVDKMVSLHSIEARVPFLDHRIVELAFSIPMNLKIKNKTTKYILKQAVRGIIPDEIIDRKKKGFGAPVSEWLNTNKEVRDKLIDILNQSQIKTLNLFDYQYINQLMSDHVSGRHDNSFKIWNLVTLSLWYDNWIR
ncbi:MAG: asparagine synthase, partial [Parcubacteria group bacterium]|nr:asparagine synthase [Parcubacteria group bacterium]